MSLSEKKIGLDKAIRKARDAFESFQRGTRSDAQEKKLSDELTKLRREAGDRLQEYLETPPDPDPRLALIPIEVHIGSKGCADRYRTPNSSGERDKPQSCLCGPGKCWVTYARRQHEHGQAAMPVEMWVQAGMPDPLPSRSAKRNAFEQKKRAKRV